MATAWKSRIVSVADVPVGELTPHPLNPRTHPDVQADPLRAILGEVGWVGRVVVSKRTDTVLDGHLRLRLAKEKGEATVPVVYVDLEPHEEAAIVATFDRLSYLAQTDSGAFAELAYAVTSPSDHIQSLLSNYLDDVEGQQLVTTELEVPPPPTALPGIIVRVGDFTFPATREQFLAWQEEVRNSVGWAEDDIEAEILRRLGL